LHRVQPEYGAYTGDGKHKYAIVHQYNKLPGDEEEGNQNWAGEIWHYWKNEVIKKCTNRICGRASTRNV
jgi:hypothetical protein